MTAAYFFYVMHCLCLAAMEWAMMTRQVAAIIVHYGDSLRTVRAVQSHWCLGVFSEIIVIANDLSRRPEELDGIPCTWLIPERNIGFGGACQLGALTRRRNVYAFFNSHVTMDKFSADQCVAAFDRFDVGIASPCVYHPGRGDAAVDWKNTLCRRTYSDILRLPIQVPLADGQADSGELIDNDLATGGAIFCRYEVIRDVGWDGSYFLGFEDADISMRAKKRGWSVVVVPSAIAMHSGESTRTATTSSYYAMRNALWFARKFYDRRIQVLITLHFLLLLCRVTAADAVKRRRPPRWRPAIHGVVDGWLLWPVNPEALPGEPLWPRS
jgi:GT2 family glycosyltransferase